MPYLAPQKNKFSPTLFSLVIATTLGLMVFWHNSAADTKRRDFYFPNTEELAEDEMRVIALGTGTPHARPAQASAAWLVELGNGEKFIFDIGKGAVDNLGALETSFNKLNKVFISHLHMDHMGDLDALYIGGWVSYRVVPLEVYGPSGKKKKYGTAYAMDRMKEMYSWDIDGRRGAIAKEGSIINAHEFDYSKTQVIYDKDGVVIKSFPAIHVMDGAVSYSLEWKGLKFVYSGDTVPNRWFMEEGKDADILVHECYFTVNQLINKKGDSPERAHRVGTVFHTPPISCGKIFAALEPRMAVPYHIFTDFDIAPEAIADIRKSYSGKMALADDMMVWNITQDEIIVRMTVAPDEVWPPDPDSEEVRSADAKVSGPRNATNKSKNSDWLEAGREIFDEE